MPVACTSRHSSRVRLCRYRVDRESGGAGAEDLGRAVMRACDVANKSGKDRAVKWLYDFEAPIADKITTIAKEMYGADGVTFTSKAKAKLETYTRLVRAVSRAS